MRREQKYSIAGVGMESSSSSSSSRMCKLAHPNLAWKGYKGKANNCLRVATQRMHKALQFSFRDRRNRERDFRSLWNLRINAATQQHDFAFGNFMHGLFLEKIQLNRKVLSQLSIQESNIFKALIDISGNALSGNKNTEPSP